MNFREVPLDVIDFEDETFRISEDLDLPAIKSSLHAVGQIHPVMLVESPPDKRFRIVCGFRRIHALRELGVAEAAARVRPPGMLELFLTAIWDNLSHRRFGPLEASRILNTLRDVCGVEDRRLVGQFLPLLGLSPHENVLHSHLKLRLLQPDLRRMLQAGHLTLSSAERLAREPLDVQARVAGPLARIRLSASLQREVLELAQDLAAIMRATLAEVLGQPDITALTLDSTLSAFQRGEKVHAFLYRQRNPRISLARDKFRADTAAMGLPGTVQLSADPYFESPRLRVEFDVTSAREFRETVAALERSSRKAALERLFEVS